MSCQNQGCSPSSFECKIASKYALKLLGIDTSIVSYGELLEFLERFVPPSTIISLCFDFYQNFFVLFLSDVESACLLVGKHLSYFNYDIEVLPFMDCFVVESVYPSISNNELIELFRRYGNVFGVFKQRLMPNSTKFSHILSGKRELFFLLPARETEILIPSEVSFPPFKFNVKKLCSACLTEGHSMMNCPDIEPNPLTDDVGVGAPVDDDKEADEIANIIWDEGLEICEEND